MRYTAFDVPAGTRYVKIAFGAVSDKGLLGESPAEGDAAYCEARTASCGTVPLEEHRSRRREGDGRGGPQAGGAFVLTGNLTIDPSAAPGAALLAVVTDVRRLPRREKF